MSHGAGAVRRRRVRRRSARRQPAGRQLAVGPAGLRQARRRARRRFAEPSTARGEIDEAQVERRHRALAPRSTAAATPSEGPYQIQYELQEMMQARVGIVRTEERDGAAPSRASASCADAPRTGRAPGQPRVQPRLAHALDLTTCSPCPRRSPAARSSARRAAAPTSARTTRRRTPSSPTSTSWS